MQICELCTWFHYCFVYVSSPLGVASRPAALAYIRDENSQAPGAETLECGPASVLRKALQGIRKQAGLRSTDRNIMQYVQQAAKLPDSRGSHLNHWKLKDVNYIIFSLHYL